MQHAGSVTVPIYRCGACGSMQPSPGRLEGNWCPGCKKVGTLELQLPTEAMSLARTIGGPPTRERARLEAAAFAPAVEAAIDESRGTLRDDLGQLRAADHLRVLLFLEEDGGSAYIIDVFRACKFRTKTHALRTLLMLRQAGLVEALESDRWVLTKRARDAIEAVRMAAG
jgi:DNA-binding transcriptional ArsR family regulator